MDFFLVSWRANAGASGGTRISIFFIVDFFLSGPGFLFVCIYVYFFFFLKIECRGKRRPSGHPSTGRARPPRCIVRWKCGSPRSFTTSRRSSCRGLGRDLAVSRAVREPFLSRFSTQMDKKTGFEAQKRLKDHRQRRTRWPQHHLRLSIAR